MDLNPHPPNNWTSIEGPYELSDYCLSKLTNVLILLDAWLDSGNEQDDKHALRCWSARLRPLWKSEEDTLVDSDDFETVVVRVATCPVEVVKLG